MSKLRIYGDTSGYIDVAAPATADNSTLDLSTVGNVRTDQTNSFTQRQNITGGASGRYGPYEDALRVKGNTYSYLEVEGTNSQAGVILNKDNSTGYGIGISNTGRLKLKPIASIDSTGLGNWKDQNTSGLEIDTSGYVLKPGQPAFQAVRTSNSTGVVTFNSVRYNIGNHYNSSTGVFTAPVAGVYQINWVFLDLDDNTQTDFYLDQNGSPIQNYRIHPNGSGIHKSGAITGSFFASANDTFNCRSSNGVYGSGTAWTVFSGHLVG